MILIVVKYRVKPEAVDTFLDEVAAFTAATRAEPGNLWFEWSRSVERDDEFVLIEAFKDGAGEAHVNSDHFKAGLATMKPLLAETPQIISRVVEGEGWDRMGELAIDE
ncbi:MAG TPA: antibiotic biosynthesis monooxygenase [Candidatus Nocardiopsis merdipullorum]|nr:antibiotic biosynthesis monooxygenase [Candidatus Nocardiopsis merdipullorum]